MFINNDQAVEVLGIEKGDLKNFRAYDQEYAHHFTMTDTRNLTKMSTNLSNSAKE